MSINDYADDQTDYLEVYGFDRSTVLIARCEGDHINIGLQEITQA